MGKDHQNHMAMEMVLKEHGRLSKDGAGDGLEANRVELIHGGDDSSYEQIGSERSSSPSDQQQHGSKPSSPHEITGNFIIKNSMQDQLEFARAEKNKIREENERLKIMLAKIMKDYQSLQMQLHHIMQQETDNGSQDDQDHSFEDQELVSLTLGTNPTKRPKKEEVVANEASIKGEDDHAGKLVKHGLTLGFEKTDKDQIETPKNQSPRKSLEEGKDDENEEPWPPSKVVKTQRNGEEEVAVHEQPPLKKARVSVRARCDAPTMNDGCQWRKYGQKIAKGNPCPRAYYRCTVAPGCPVRKQVQRCAEDMSILVTTYEGNHNHPLPISATAMASTTSAAACMLTSSSSTSGHIVDPSSGTTTTFSGLHNLNFNLSNNSRSSPFYLSNHSISPFPSCPTITLDLTSHPSTTSQLNRFPSSTSFNFTSNGNNYLSYTNSKNGSFTLGAFQPQDQLYPSYLQKNSNNNPTQAELPSDTIAAATKVLTSDPNFKSALAAAITSMVSNGRREANSANILKWGEQSQSLSSFTASHVINSCSPSFLSRSSSTTPNTQFGFLPPPSQLSSAATDASASPMDNREHTS